MASCASGPTLVDGPAPPQRLAWGPLQLRLPARVDPPAPRPIPLPGPWTRGDEADGVVTWEAPLPVRLRTLFFHRPPDDMALLRAESGRALPFARRDSAAARAGSWAFSADRLRVRRRAADGPPAPDELELRYTRASDREDELRVGQSALAGAAWTARSLQSGPLTRRGLLLVPGAELRVPAQIPRHGRLRFHRVHLPPEVADPRHPPDGARLRVWLRPTGGEEALLAELSVMPGDDAPVDLDLSAVAPGPAELRLEVVDEGDPHQDYIFLADPRILAPAREAPRAVVLFIDTLRRDALGIYGSRPDVSPHIDAWAAGAAVFDAARSVAPWTLPATRAMVSGRQPEAWDAGPTIMSRFAEAGWATGFFGGNVYLSSNFGMAEGWGHHRVVNWPAAGEQVDAALAWLEQHAHEPALLVLHLMDPHLPYTEPAAFRDRFAGPRPAELPADDFLRGDLVEGTPGPEVQAWVRGRYANNVAYVDHELQRVFSVLRPTDTVVLISDHGEEFWEHGGFEHGHSLHEELLQIPLIARGPGFAAGRWPAATSTLDLAPTLLRAAGLGADDLPGSPLQDLDGPAPPERPLAFGRPLYGVRRWGAVAGGIKYTTTAGEELLFDLQADPAEVRPLAAPAAALTEARGALAAALGWTVREALVLKPGRGGGFGVELRAPGGIDGAFLAEDPIGASDATLTPIAEGVRVDWAPSSGAPREVVVLLRDLSAAAIAAAAITMPGASPAPLAPEGPGAGVLAVHRAGGRTVTVSRATVPVPPDAAGPLIAVDAELRGELEALGYLDP